MSAVLLKRHAEQIWRAALQAAQPRQLLSGALLDPNLRLKELAEQASHITVVGAGKAGASMSEALEDLLSEQLPKMKGLISVPDVSVRPLRAIHLFPGRSAASNRPTVAGVEVSEQIIESVKQADSTTLVLCLLSGGASALLPAPASGVSLEDKVVLIDLLDERGATINEINAVRKHVSRIKGGRLAAGFRGSHLITLIISDVIGDPVDVIGSGPTAVDPTTFADALEVLKKYNLVDQVPRSIREHLEHGLEGRVQDTPKILPINVKNVIIGNNARSVQAANATARSLGYHVLNLGSFIAGESRNAAFLLADIARSVIIDGQPTRRPACILCGGETTVSLPKEHGLGGRNTEFALAALVHLLPFEDSELCVFSAGTDGEDGPTRAAGACAGPWATTHARQLGLDPNEFLQRHDSFHYFETTGELVCTGLTETNVMDIRFILLH
jgi:hydroxypyruvate reductase/glycerate 2-kinase